MFLLVILSAEAATLTVDGVKYKTVASALAASVDGDTIAIPAGTWYECLTVTTDVTIAGAGSGSTTLDGGGVCDTVLDITADDVILSGMTVTAPGGQGIVAVVDTLTTSDVSVVDSGGSAVASGAGLAFTGTTLTMSDATLTGHTAQACAAISLSSGATAVLADVTISENEATTGAGAGICAASSAASPASLSVTDATFQENSSVSGGSAIDLGSHAELRTVRAEFTDNLSGTPYKGGSTVHLDDATTYASEGDTFTGNIGFVAGAIDGVEDGVTIVVAGATIEDNWARNAKGAISIDGTGTTLEVHGSSFANNSYSIVSDGPPIEIYTSSFADDSDTAIVSEDLNLEDCDFTNAAGGFSIQNTGDLTVVGGSFRDHSDKPGILFAGGRLTIDGTVFEDNLSSYTGAAVLYVSRAEQDVTITDARFERNLNDSRSVDYGGAITIKTDVTLNLIGTSFIDNEARFGGAVATFGSPLIVDGCTFSGNTAAVGGGAIWVGRSYEIGWSGTPEAEVTDSWFLDNSTTHTDSWGGAIYLEGNSTAGTLSVSRSVLAGNSSAGKGGGIYLKDFGSLGVDNSYLCGNGAYAIEVDTVGAVAISNSILSENLGGVKSSKVTTMTMSHDTLVGNDHSSGGGATFSGTSGSITDSIVAYTVSGDGVYAADSTSGSIKVTYNDWYKNTSTDRSGDFTFPTAGFGNTTADPLFDDFSVDGDCWNDRLSLQSSSTLIDAGSDLDADGTTGDLGATGGPDAAWRDADGDLWMWPWDCDDADAVVSPGAPETCNGVDDDCDGEIDVGAADGTPWYVDADDDGVGGTEFTTACDAPDGTTAVGGDCDDHDAKIGAPTAEIPYDGVDQDCNGKDLRDVDGDGYDADVVSGPDCDDADASIHPGAADATADGVDQDCDGVDGPDPDTDTDTDTDTDSDTDADTDRDSETDTDPVDPGCKGCDSQGQPGMIAALAGLVMASRRRARGRDRRGRA